MGTNEYSQPASKSSWDSQDFCDVKMVLKTAHFHKSSWPQWVKLDFQNVDQHTGGKWLIHGTKRSKDNQLRSLELSCRIS